MANVNAEYSRNVFWDRSRTPLQRFEDKKERARIVRESTGDVNFSRRMLCLEKIDEVISYLDMRGKKISHCGQPVLFNFNGDGAIIKLDYKKEGLILNVSDKVDSGIFDMLNNILGYN